MHGGGDEAADEGQPGHGLEEAAAAVVRRGVEVGHDGWVVGLGKANKGGGGMARLFIRWVG